jgi:hypothetical protein
VHSLRTYEKSRLEASTLHLAILRDLRRVNSHVSAIAYDVLGLVAAQEAQDELTGDAAGSQMAHGGPPTES